MRIKMMLERETKGAARYYEGIERDGMFYAVGQTDPACVIGTLYIRKTALGDKIPHTITVEITPDA